MFVEHWVESSRSYLLWFSRWVCCATVKSSKCFQCSMQFCQLCVPLTLKRTKKNQKNINANNAQLTNPSWFGNAKKNLLGTYWGPFFDSQAFPTSKSVKTAENPKRIFVLFIMPIPRGHQFGIFWPFPKVPSSKKIFLTVCKAPELPRQSPSIRPLLRILIKSGKTRIWGSQWSKCS